MFTGEIENNNLPLFAELIEYVPNPGKTRTIIKHTNTNSIFLSIAANAGSAEVNLGADIYIQVITGNPELTINSVKYYLKPGDGKIIPANSSYSFNPSLHFKMIMSIIQTVLPAAVKKKYPNDNV